MTRIQKIGNIGERIAMDYVKSLGYKVIKSSDPYDSVKDFYYDKDNKVVHAEVKTQQPYVLREQFTFAPNQLKKCSEVDELYIVTIPPLMRPSYEHSRRIFRLRPTTNPFLFERYTTKLGKDMIGIPIYQENIECVGSVSDEDTKKLFELARSDYK